MAASFFLVFQIFFSIFAARVKAYDIIMKEESGINGKTLKDTMLIQDTKNR